MLHILEEVISERKSEKDPLLQCVAWPRGSVSIRKAVLKPLFSHCQLGVTVLGVTTVLSDHGLMP